ncbi:MAG: FecR domain-containing protein [Pirellulales bacterium]|nr:FecR domain-containing protein [Pirellulales bacterium]
MTSDGERNRSDADFVAAVQQYLDGALAPDEQAGLFDRLRREPRARTLFVRSILQAAHLHELLAQQRSAGGETSELTEPTRRPPEDFAAPCSPPPIDAPGASDPAGPAAGATLMQGWLGGRFGFGLVGAALIVVAALLVFARRDADRLAQGPSPNGDPRITATGAPREVFDPRSIHLDSGSARVTLPKVGYMLVDGPADVDLVAPLRAKLNLGRIRVRVTEPSGHGFVVETPDGEVVDLSTEFGLDVAEGESTGVVVFDGAVDLRLDKSTAGDARRVQRLVGGEGVTFNKLGRLDRIGSIMTGNVKTFLANDEGEAQRRDAVIVRVADNLRSEQTKKFYEIVPGGFGEDALAYADRPAHEWNGVSTAGLPEFLLGADYVKTFSDDDMRADRVIKVWLSRPATVYVIFDNRLRPPKWLETDFRKVQASVGMDLGPWPTIGHPVRRGVGPGKSVEHGFTVWERVVKTPGLVTLGGNGTLDLRGQPSKAPYMYGIAAAALQLAEGASEEARLQR